MTRPTVLVSSAGKRVHLLEIFRRTLERHFAGGRVIAADATDLSAAFHRADAGFVVPPIASEDFIPEMLRLCSREDVRLIVPTIDTELAAYAEHRHLFEARGTTVAVSGPATVEIGASKPNTNAWLSEHGFPVPRQWEPADFLARRSSLPAVAKPARGSSSIGVVVVRSNEDVHRATRDGDFVIEELAAGDEHTVDVYVDRSGVARCPVPRRRLEVRAGEVSKGVTVDVPELEALVVAVAQRLPDAYGCLNVQAFVTNGDIRIIEINPRFGGGFPLAWEAGAEHPRWLLEEALGQSPSFPTARTWRVGLLMLRYDDAVFVEPKDA